MLESAIAEIQPSDATGSDDGIWIEALPARVYHTPVWGDIPVTHDKLQRFIHNFHSNVRGQEIATDYDHGIDPAKGMQASGWYRDFEIRPSSDDPTQMSLFAKVQLTDDAKKDVKDGKYKYWSVEWDDEYETDSGQIVPDVVIGGGLTNRPVAKRTMPINFSEKMWENLSDEDKKYAARIMHERKLLSEKSVADAANVLIAKGFELRLSETAAQEHSDPGIGTPLYATAQKQPDPGTGAMVPRVTGDAAQDDKAIANGWRRDPLPVLDEQHKDDPITQQESRQSSGDEPHNPGEPATFSEGGKTSMKLSEAGVNQLTKLFEFETPVDTDEAGVEKAFLDKAANAFSELKTFKDTVGGTRQEKTFAEQYPEQHEKMQRLEAKDRATAAIAFSETVKRFNKPTGNKDDEGNVTYEPTRNGLSAVALETIAEKHKLFSEGKASVTDFEETISAIMNGGIVEFGEVGSSRDRDEPVAADTSTATGIAASRRAFAEVVAGIQEENPDKFGGSENYSAAIAEAGKRYPELAAAYRATAA